MTTCRAASSAAIVATLLYMVQLASISQDPWFSRAQSPHDVDFAAIDLDPMDGAPFSRVRDVARWVRDELELLGVDGHVKTSGARGLHIYLPMRPGTPFEAGMLFCRLIASVVAGRHPEAATVERAVKRRDRRRRLPRLPAEQLRQDAGLRLQRARQRLRGRVDAARLGGAGRRRSTRAISRSARCRRACATVGDLWARAAQGDGDRSGGGARARPAGGTGRDSLATARAGRCPGPKDGNSTRHNSRRLRSMRSKMLARSARPVRRRPRLLAAGAARADDDDPAKGKFTLEQATKGLSGSGPLTAKIETTLGTFTCELYDKQAPITVANFVGLARGLRPWKDPKTGKWVEKKPFYDGLIFHRVIPGFMIQGGDPLGIGTGNPGYTFEDEFSPDLKFDKPGAARDGQRRPAAPTARSSSSPRGRPQHLTGRHTIFGLCEPVSLVSKITGVEARPARQTGDRRRHEEGDDLARQGQEVQVRQVIAFA